MINHMQTPIAGRGFVVICDRTGIIENVVQNEYEPALLITIGSPLASVFDEGCRQKAHLFFSEVCAKRSAFDWEFVIPLATGPATLHCAATVLEDGVMVIGAGSRDSIDQVMEAMLRLHNEQGNQVRTLMKELQISSRGVGRDNDIYNEQAQLNNQLSNMQREQLKKNHELEQLNRKLQELTEEQQIILENAGVGIALVKNRKRKWVNTTFCKMFGYSTEEMSDVSTRPVYPSDEDYEQFGNEAYAVLATGETVVRHRQLLRRDGTLFTARISGTAIDAAQPNDGSIWIFTDVTAQMILEEKLQKSHDLLTSLSHQVPGMICQFQLFPDGRFCFPYTSNAIIEMYEVTPDEVKEDASPVMHIVHPDDLEGVRASLMESSQTLEPWDYDFRVKLPMKGVQWRHGFSRPVKLEDGSTLWHGFINDVTAQKQSELELEHARKAAESANRAKSEFLANMSHEIRTPMNGVIGMTQLLELTDLTDEQAKYVTTLRNSGHNLLSLINNILDLSKIESGIITLEKTEFNLEQSIKDVVMMQKQAVHQKGLSLDSNLSQDIPAVLLGDQLRVKQILINLVGNAVKFTSQGGISITVNLLEKYDKTALIQIAVRDTGTGIAPGALDKIFKPFIQEDGSITRKFGGTGLGLSICRSLAELMDGSITIESTPGVGSCFIVVLPFAIGKSRPLRQARVLQPKAKWDGPPLKILLVEDDPVNISFAMSLLKKLGHVAVSAVNGMECLALLEDDGFDLLLMDIQMPMMNGEDTLRNIRTKEQETSKHQLVIAVTAHSLRGDKERFFEMGFDGYLSKPLETRQLITELQRVIGINNVPGDGVK